MVINDDPITGKASKMIRRNINFESEGEFTKSILFNPNIGMIIQYISIDGTSNKRMQRIPKKYHLYMQFIPNLA